MVEISEIEEIHPIIPENLNQKKNNAIGLIEKLKSNNFFGFLITLILWVIFFLFLLSPLNKLVISEEIYNEYLKPYVGILVTTLSTILVAFLFKWYNCWMACTYARYHISNEDYDKFEETINSSICFKILNIKNFWGGT